jgi:hypothetical protein
MKKILLFIFLTILTGLSGCNFTQSVTTPTPAVTPIPAFTPVPPTVSPLHSYHLGTVIQFNRSGNGKNFLVSGWSEPEEGFTWTTNKKAELLLQINQKEITCDVIMRVNLEPDIGKGKTDRQRVYIYANDRKIGEWIASSPGEYKIIIPEVYLMDPLLRIMFELPDAVSQKSNGTGEDSRTRGIKVMTMVLMEIYRPGEKIMFIKGGNGDHYKGQGWSNPEDKFTWTDGKRAELTLPVGDVRADLTMKVFTGGLINQGKLDRQRVNIHINGNKIGQWLVKEKREYAIKIPKNSIVNNNLNIVFDLPDASVPKNIGLNENDNRTLGLCVEYIILESGQ